MNNKFSKTWIFDYFPKELKENIVSFDLQFYGGGFGQDGAIGRSIFTTSNLRHGPSELIGWILELIPKKIDYLFPCKIAHYPQSNLEVIQFSKCATTRFCDVSILTP